MLCEHSIVWNKTFHRNNKYETKTGNNGAKKELLPIRSYFSKNWCEQEVHMNSYGDSHLENYEIMSASEREQAEPAHSERRMPIMNEVHDITFINLFF